MIKDPNKIENTTDKRSSFNEIFIKGQTYKDVLSKKEVWKELEKLYNGSFNVTSTVSRDITTLTLEIPYKGHKLILKETDTKPLKGVIHFNLTKKIEFNIQLRDWTDWISSFFGKHVIQTNNAGFDKRYSIQSDDSPLTLTILTDNKIIEKILSNDLYSLILNYDKTTKTHTLLTVKDRNTKEIIALKELIDLNFGIVDSLMKQGLICH
jgi:hypothetical protein